MERSAYLATAWRLGRYYRTYPAYVEDEVKATLDDPASQFQRGPITIVRRGTAASDAWVAVQDRNYVSARWPGDAYLFARRFCQLLESRPSARQSSCQPVKVPSARPVWSPRDGDGDRVVPGLDLGDRAVGAGVDQGDPASVGAGHHGGAPGEGERGRVGVGADADRLAGPAGRWC